MCTPCSLYLHTSIAHLYHHPSHFSPAAPQPWSPPLPWPSAGISADASTPLRTDNPSSLTLLQLSSPHWQSSPTAVCSAAGQSSNRSLPPVLLPIVFACTCGLALLLLSSPEATTSLSPLYLSGPLAASSLHSDCFKVMLSSRLWSCLGTDCAVLESWEGRRVR